ncbi:MAG: hypothetical protein A2622_00475 [Bdellovibrionales bacterium RIFCSPHIGHO2_01_FULL_40_29]|nr:MAG: hypothetical protein A2622_00475 [Bdellovibrionales bacterium RIFCSPHIGHO2_01_FULL_40_29]OFZ32598.1 MAG: hypothetical protein A3D17_05075 [Bdellovibrionales bacterium RIFCSPHIGHO2_02_FULL_40_15]
MKAIIIEFDKFLSEKNLNFKAVIIGGAALNILDISSRKTKDVDCLDPEIPQEIIFAAKDFAEKFTNLELDHSWLNNGPKTLKKDLPNGWRNRIQPIFRGQSITLDVLGREDFLKSKLFAYCDRLTPDFEDLKDLRPTVFELNDAIDWVKKRDSNSNWPQHVEKSFSVLKKALGHD